MHNAEDLPFWRPNVRSPDVLVLVAPVGVTLLAAGLGQLVHLAAGPRIDPFLRDVLVFLYGTLGPPAVGLVALATGGLRGTDGEGGLGRAAVSALVMLPGYWAVVLAVCAGFALDFPQIGALGLLASYAAFCSFAAWLLLRQRPRLQQGIATVLLLAVGAAGAIPDAREPLGPAIPLLPPLGRPPPAPPPLAPEPPAGASPDPLPPVGMQLPQAEERVRPRAEPGRAQPGSGRPSLGADRPWPAPERERPDADGSRLDPGRPQPDSDLTRPEPRRGARLEDRIQRQLARNGLSRVDIRVEPDAVVATGRVRSAEEQLRLRLVVESLAPHLVYVDLTRIGVRR